MKNTKYYYIWIEGFSPKRGEKVHCVLGNYDYKITTRMSDAMRVKPEHVHIMKDFLRRHGVADWCVDNPNTFVPINYAPAGTIFRPWLP